VLLQVSLHLRRLIAKILFFISTIYIHLAVRVCLAIPECIAKKPGMEEGKNRAGRMCNTNMLPKQESLCTDCLIQQHYSFQLISQNKVISEKNWGMV